MRTCGVFDNRASHATHAKYPSKEKVVERGGYCDDGSSLDRSEQILLGEGEEIVIKGGSHDDNYIK